MPDDWGGNLALIVGQAIASVQGMEKIHIGGSLEKAGQFIAEGAGAQPPEGTAELNTGDWIWFDEVVNVEVCVSDADTAAPLSLQPITRAAYLAALAADGYSDPKITLDTEVIYVEKSEREPTVGAGFTVSARTSRAFQE